MTGDKHPPAVSVVVIFHNEERYLADAIDSVVAQDFVNWEMVLVDDGSTDRSAEIALAAAVSDSRICCVSQPGGANLGASAARNLGVARARGVHVAFLDADDLWLPHKLSSQLGHLATHPGTRAVYGPLTLFGDDPTVPGFIDGKLYGLECDGVIVESDRVYHPPELVTLFIPHNDLYPSGAMFERALYHEIGGADPEFRDYYEDGVLWLKMCLCASVYCTSESTYLYRQHADSSTAVAARSGRGVQEETRYFDWVEEYLGRQPGEIAHEVWKALAEARRPYLHPYRHKALETARRLRRRLSRLRRSR